MGSVELGVGLDSSAEGYAVMGPPNTRSSIAERVSQLELDVRIEQQNRNAERRAASTRMERIESDAAGVAQQLEERIRTIADDFDVRLREQARDGVGIAAFGAVLVFAGTFLDLLTEMSNG